MRGRFGRVVLAGLLSTALAACTGRTPEPKIEYREVPVPVAVGCVVDRPEAVKPMNSVVTAEQWGQLAPGAKAAAVEAQAGDRLNYEDRLLASTSGCPVKDSSQSGSTGGPENLLPPGKP